MNIDWWALVLVGLVSISMSVVFVILLSAGIRLVVAARERANHGAVALSAGYGLLGLAGLLVLFGLYLIVPQFH